MKKYFVPVLLALGMFLTGCEEKSAPENPTTGSTTTTSDPSYSIIYSDPPDVFDGMTKAVYYDKELIVVRCGDNYLCLEEYIYDEWLADVPAILGEDDLPMGKPLRLIADVEVTSGGIDGRTKRSIKEIKQWDFIEFDDLDEEIHHWEMSLQYNNWESICDNIATRNQLALVYRYTWDGAVYALGNTSDGRVAICRNGELMGIYDGITVISYPDELGQPERILLRNNGFNTDTLVPLLEEGTIYNDDFYFIGACYVDSISERFVEEYNYFADTCIPLSYSLTAGAEKVTLELSDEFYEEYYYNNNMPMYISGKGYFIKSDSLLKLNRITVNENNQPHLIFNRIENSENSDGCYAGVLMAERAVAGVDFSDFTYEIIE